jgi:hypothetical protein
VKLRQATPSKHAASSSTHFPPTTPHLDDALMALVELNAAQACASCSADAVGAAQAALLQWVAACVGLPTRWASSRIEVDSGGPAAVRGS